MKITDGEMQTILASNGVKFQYVSHPTRGEICMTEGSTKRDVLLKGIRELIALAQEVEPLKFRREHGCLWCKTSIGEYSIHLHDVDGGYVFELEECEQDACVYGTEEQAIEAAQQDYARRVRSGLKYGGGE